MDTGWGKTVDEYFTGFHPMIHASVDTIFTNVVDCLLADKKRRFLSAEMKLFSMWFYRQDEKKKDLVRQLVWNGQFELIQGGWSAPDEACPNYEEFITNIYLGHNFMKKEFGVTTKIGW